MPFTYCLMQRLYLCGFTNADPNGLRFKIADMDHYCFYLTTIKNANGTDYLLLSGKR